MMADELDQLLDSLAVPNGSLSGLVDDAVPEMDPMQGLELTRDKKPKEAARARRLTAETGLPLEVTEQEGDNLELELKFEEILRDVEGSPVTARTVANPVTAPIVRDSAKELSAVEQAFISIQQGARVHERGALGARARSEGFGPEILEDLNTLERKMEEAGVKLDETGYKSWFNSAAEILGQMGASLFTVEGAERVTLGAATGTAIGAGFGGVGAAPGFFTGITAGATAHVATQAYITEGGNAYLDMVGEGIEEDIAGPVSHGIGMVNALLETAGVSVVAAPFTASFKKLVLDKAKGEILELSKQEFFKRALKEYAKSVAAETGTEMLQEVVNMAGEEMAKALDPKEFDALTEEEAVERLSDIAVKTFKGMVILGAPGPVSHYAADTYRARQAKRQQEAITQLKENIEKAEVTRIAPEVAQEHVVETMAETQIKRVLIPVDKILEQRVDPYRLIPDATPEQVAQLEEARVLGQDLELTPEQFSQLLLSEDFEALSDHMRFDYDQMTADEAKEFGEGGLTQLIEELGLGTEETIDIAERTPAEQELGLQALFRTAADAGMTKKEYEAYLVKLQKAADQKVANLERRRLVAEKRLASKEIASRRTELQETARETVDNQPVYSALNGIGVDRLDRVAVENVIGAANLKKLPKQDKRNIYTNKGTRGVHPDLIAEMYGFEGADIMLFAMMDAPSRTNAIAAETERLLQEQHHDLFAEVESIDAEIEALHNDQQAAVLEVELNQMRKVQGQKRLRQAVVKKAAKQRIQETKVGDLNPSKFLAAERREGRKAGQLLRKGERQAATEAKFRQLLNYNLAQEAFRVRDRQAKQLDYLRQFKKKRKKFPSIPADYLAQIRMIVDDVAWGAKMTTASKEALQTWVKQRQDEGFSVEIPQKLLDEGKMNYQDLTVKEMQLLHDSVKALEKQGRDENKLARSDANDARDKSVQGLTAMAVQNLKGRPPPIAPGTGRGVTDFTRELAMLAANMDSIVRTIDGFQEFGPAYDALKRPYDLAVSHGYLPGRMGYIQRQKQEAERILELTGVYSKKEQVRMHDRFQIPGVRDKMSRNSMLSAMLNMGNEENLIALRKTFSDAEIEAIKDYASEKDWQFVQSVWKYLDEFWPEIKDTIARRTNAIGEKVEAQPVETKYGTFTGGYYPIVYDAQHTTFAGKTTEELITEGRFGTATSSRTRARHTHEREGTPDNARLKLDLFEMNNHVAQVVYDLEVGDAIRDIYKVLYHPDTRTTFDGMGQSDTWRAMDLWLGDVAMGEMHAGGRFQALFRHLRTGFTASKIGFNIGTMALQPLGILNTTTQVGKMNTLAAMVPMINPMTQMGPNSIYQQVQAKSNVMAQREENWNKEIADAQMWLSSNWKRRLTPGESAAWFANAAFYGIKKMQKWVDTFTWLAAYRKGMRDNNGVEEMAIDFADRMVIRSQATGIFGDRTPLERGTVHKKFRQNELVRSMVPLISYFMAKSNVVYERTKKTNFANPASVLNWVTDMILVYTVEAAAASVIYGRWPDEDEDWKVFVLWETVRSMTAGTPLFRDLASEMEGFRGGGVYNSVLWEAGAFGKQLAEGEMDEAFFKSAMRLGGTLFKIPGASQVTKTGTAFNRANQGEDVTMLEFLMGPRWNE